jgi:hypothetical protein
MHGWSGEAVRLRTIFVAGISLLLVVAFATPAAEAAKPAVVDPTSCVYRPLFPARISVDQAIVAPRIGISANDPACTAAGLNWFVNTELVRGSDSLFYAWDDSAATDAESIFSFEVVPGTYAMVGADSDVYDASDFSVDIASSVTDVSTVIKFTGRVGLTATRSKNVVTLRAQTVRWSTGSSWIPAASTVVDFERWINGTKTVAAHWQTFQRVRANGAGQAQFHYTNAKPMRYRLVSEDTTQAFGSATGTQAR